MRDWEKAPLKEVAPAKQPEFPKPYEVVWDVSLDDIESETGRLLTEKTTLASKLGSSKVAFDERNVLYMKLRPYLNKVLLPDKFGVGSSELIPLRPQPNLLDRRYLWYYLRSPRFVHFANKNTAGANLPRVSMSVFWEHEIPLPPLPVQRRLAAVLDKADALRRKRRRALDRLDDLLQAVFLDMFGDPVTNPKGWNVRELSELIDPTRPITYGILKPGPDIPNGIPYVRVLDMQDGRVSLNDVRRTTPEIAEEYRRSTLRANDLLLSIRGHVGRLAIVGEEFVGANITQDTARLAPIESLSVYYLAGCLGTIAMQRHMARRVKGAAVRGINLGDVKELPIPVPPIEMQHNFENIWGNIARQFDRQTEAIKKSGMLFNALMQKAFNGELDFAEDVIEDAERTRGEPAAQLSLFE